jgi:hypothetical protein
MKRLVRKSLLFIAFLLMLLLVMGVTTVLADGYHVVRPGETLFSIGRLYGVYPYSISAANGLANPDYIRIGQVLYIPGGTGWWAPEPAPLGPSGGYGWYGGYSGWYGGYGGWYGGYGGGYGGYGGGYGGYGGGYGGYGGYGGGYGGWGRR